MQPPAPRKRVLLGRVGAFAIILLWMVVAALGGPKFGEVSEVATNDQSSFLPASAESTQVQNQLENFQQSTVAPAIIAIKADSGQVDPRDFGEFSEQMKSSAGLPASDGQAQEILQASPVIPSADGQAAQMIVLPPEGTPPAEAVESLNEVIGQHLPAGYEAKISGPAGFSADLSSAFAGIDGLLLLVTIAAVFIILILVFRSPFLPIIVLLGSMIALCAALLVNVALARSGVVMINGQIQGILFILVIGAATDYGLLYVARYREELGKTAQPWQATQRALRGTWQPITASAATVIAGLLCLLFSDLASNAGLGPVAAIGIAAAWLVSLTFLPAVLGLCGRGAFWPRKPQAENSDPKDGLWPKIASSVSRRPRAIAAGMLLVLGIGCAGLMALDADGVPTSEYVLGQSDAREGQEILDQHFPPGVGAPAYVLVPADQVERSEQALREVPGIDSWQRLGNQDGSATQGDKAMLELTLADSPYSDAAEETVQQIRAAVGDFGAQVGGTTATELDTKQTSVSDRQVIFPVVLLVLAIMLGILLRALVAPLMLLICTVLSFGAALGISAVIFQIIGFEGSDPSVPLYAFVFLVALAIDYTIFLMSRVREESLTAGSHEGLQRGLIGTGKVITSAGVVLAATFAALLVIPIHFLVQLAIVISLGVLIDTLLVRSFLVPALVQMLGKKVWWPNKRVEF